MAKTLPGPLIADIRGSVGSVTWNRNQWGAYCAARKTTQSGTTPRRTAVTAALSAAAKAWSNTLTATQRNGWIQLATRTHRKDVFARAYQLTGQHLFCASYLNMSASGQAPLLNAPTALIATSPGSITASSADADAGTIGITPALACPADHVTVIEATPLMSPARGFIGHNTTRLMAATGLSAIPANLAPAWEAIFGGLSGPGTIGIRLRYLNTNNGITSSPAVALVAVTGTGGTMLISVTNMTASGTYTLPTGATSLFVEAWGAGGGGGAGLATSSNASAGGGGASGSYASLTVTTPASSYTVTVGAGGTADTTGSGGGTGGATSFGSLCTTNGGTGGAVGTTPGTVAARSGGAAGGAAGLGDYTAPGTTGGLGLVISATVATPGSGAAAPLGGVSAPINWAVSSGAGGQAGSGPGAGGQGGANAGTFAIHAGGAGGGGLVRIWAFK